MNKKQGQSNGGWAAAGGLNDKGKAPARPVLKARILLEADASEAGEGWSDQRIAAALDTSIDTIARTRQQLVEGGLHAALTRGLRRFRARSPASFGALLAIAIGRCIRTMPL